jgi:hypothetical protein
MRMASGGYPPVGHLLNHSISGFLGSAVGWFFSQRAFHVSALCLAACLSLLALLGCGRAAGPEFAPVTGRVTLNGGAPTGCEIVFIPDSTKGHTGPSSVGRIDPEGYFSLTGPGGRKGAVLGHHRAYIHDLVADITPSSDEEAALLKAHVPIPRRLRNIETANMTVEVTQSGNEFIFELKEAGK